MKHLTPVWFSIMLASGVIASSAIAAPTAPTQSQPATIAQTDSSTSESIAIQQLTQFSNVLISVLYFGLPCSFLLAVLVHNHGEAQHQQLLAARLVPIRIKDRS
jgi:hypothetical protein